MPLNTAGRDRFNLSRHAFVSVAAFRVIKANEMIHMSVFAVLFTTDFFSVTSVASAVTFLAK
jgi:hypothetical protein